MPGAKGRSGGHNAKTSQHHRLSGTFDKRRHTGRVGPTAPPGVPTPPKPLTGEALAEWERMIERLTALGSLSTADGAVLYRYCHLHAQTERLQADLEQLETSWFLKVTVDGAGQEHQEAKVHPLFAQYRAYVLALRVYLTEFGLTPASRGRVKLPEKPTERDPFAEFDAPTAH
jgi:P27 family predicted phage terminase small subunit